METNQKCLGPKHTVFWDVFTADWMNDLNCALGGAAGGGGGGGGGGGAGRGAGWIAGGLRPGRQHFRLPEKA
jgi:hypothetical protein